MDDLVVPPGLELAPPRVRPALQRYVAKAMTEPHPDCQRVGCKVLRSTPLRALRVALTRQR